MTTKFLLIIPEDYSDDVVNNLRKSLRLSFQGASSGLVIPYDVKLFTAFEEDGIVIEIIDPTLLLSEECKALSNSLLEVKEKGWSTIKLSKNFIENIL